MTVDTATALTWSDLARDAYCPPSVEIKISSEQATVKVGTPIWIDTVTTNIGYHDIGIGSLPGPYQAFEYSVTVQVRDNQDRPVGPEAVDQSSCKGDPICMVVFLETRYLKPGESVKDRFLIDQKFDLSRPGTYTVQIIRREKPTGPFYEIAKSNVLTFTVI